ncbi:hypothetical protein RQM47_13355 [Rubrivirga sp. S365]|uniref:Lipoprotein n=1 Tax=Rubrivirga litoralis TaxID=3075598 RepID=A0ABU3BMZ8_9BACT|nr:MULTISPECIES: hypothetical protein [unclassified Rubrivirga]MDT0630653.1 hypothetical protein [Rubrivirga sp. F394]MDT7857634.1 hypothetical protein [Rubrivirga sp. S365]
MRLLLLLLAAAVAAAGCDAVPSPGDLAPGTFELSVGGRTSQGEARFYPSLEFQFNQAAVYLRPCAENRFVIESDEFLAAEPGDRFEPRVDYRPPGRSYQRVGGTVEVTEQTAEGVRGRFSVRLRDFSTGPGTGGDVTARGAFYAVTSEVGEGC